MRLLSYPVEGGDTLDDPRWQPLKITARMAEPVILTQPEIHLDGSLAWAAFGVYQDLGSPDGELEPLMLDSLPWAADFDLPVARWTAPLAPGVEVDARLLTDRGEVWGWACSDVTVEWAAHARMEVRKRPAHDEMILLTEEKRLQINLGTLKAYDLAYPAFIARGPLTWYAIGDRDAVASLLARVPALGKKTHSGNGRLLRPDPSASAFTVEVHEEALERWTMRRWPTPEGRGRRVGIRPPYHHHSRRLPSARMEGRP